MVEKTKIKKSEKGKKAEEKSETKTLAGAVLTRGRTFEGTVTKKFDKRIVIEFERTVRVPKYERFMKKKTRLHARTPHGMDVNIGDYVKVSECRPLSKMIHFMLTEIVRKAEIEGVKAK